MPPLPPRRRKNGLERTAPIPETTAEAVDAEIAKRAASPALESELLGGKPKTLADLAPSLAAERREGTAPTPARAGAVDRRRPTATPTPQGRRCTMPPVLSGTERDRIAALSTGVAPGLASEKIVLPRELSGDTVKEAKNNPESLPRPIETSDDGWPAPSRTLAAHPDDWTPQSAAQTGDTPTPKPDAAPAPSLKEPQVPSASPAEPVKPRAASIQSQQPAVVQMARPVVLSQPFKAADVAPIPPVPEAGLLAALKYTVSFASARWQRRGAIGDLRGQISKDTGILDGILGTLGRHTRSLGLENKALEAENKAIDGAEDRRKTAEHSCSELSNRQAEENSKFAGSEGDRQGKVAEADSELEVAQTELGALEAQRRDLRDQRKTIENRQKGYLKAADSRDADSEKQESREKREELRNAATTLRKDAELLTEERLDIDRRYDALEQPQSQLNSRVDALKSDRDAAKGSLTDLREGHRHRLAEIDAEQGRKSRELAQAEAEIERRYVTLGTLVNLNRIERSEFIGIYEQIDSLRGAIGARSNEIDKLSAERQAFDKSSLILGACVLGGAVLLVLALLAILLTAL
ncbi:MAG: hypothetical protein GY811_17755 [Myxococcales bacterium]|nr:hypothetical protein [Myxococcales bacterium]